MAQKPKQEIQRPPQQLTALDFLRRYKGEIEKVLPKHLDAGRMFRIAEGAVNRDVKLQACTGASLMRSVMQAAALGLEIGVLGEAWLIPFKTDCQLVPGYQGLIKLAVQSGAVVSINVGAIWPNDEHNIDLGSEARVIHKPSPTEPPEGHWPIWYYCSIRMTGGGTQTTVMAKWEIDAIKRKAPGARSPLSPWQGTREDQVEMGKKTVIRRALKNVPKTPQLTRALEYDERRDAGKRIDVDLFPDLPAQGELPEEPKDVNPPPSTTASEVAADLAAGIQAPPDDTSAENNDEIPGWGKT